MDELSALKYSGENLLALINDILDFNKLESEKVLLEEVIFSPADLVKKTIHLFGYKAKERKNTINFKKEKRVPEFVLGDKIRLGQILNNLIGNSLKFTENGKIIVRIDFLSENKNNCTLNFSVKDTGIGVAFDKQKLIFDSFTQEKSDISRRFGGSGLGLAISKKLVELQGGKISVKSKSGTGSTFSFSIVYKKLKESDRTEDIDEKFDKKDLSKKKILVVEDNAINRVVTRRFLENWNVRVEEAEHGAIAIEKVKQNKPDLILMDLQMPVMDGYEATKRIKSMENGKFNSIPIIALTASVLLDVKEQIREAGLDDFLLKPFKVQDLQRILSKHLR